jgi:hypothetical protein
MMISIRTLRSLTARTLGMLTLALVVVGPLGCEDKAGDKKEETKKESAAEEAADGEEAAAVPSDDDLAKEAKEAKEAINADNADEQAEAVDEEVEAELGEE